MKNIFSLIKTDILFIFCGIFLFCPFSGYSSGAEISREEECILDQFKSADNSMSIGELRKKCNMKTAQEEKLPVERRLNEDDENILEPFTLMAHRPNYFMPYAHNYNGYDPELYRQEFDDPSISFSKTEVQFQISIKTPLFVNLFRKKIDVFAAYTNHSFWQLYHQASSPFRETNHEPEAWIQFRQDRKILGFSNDVNIIGVNHQSNGRGGVLSRSWNRIYASFVFEKDNFVLNISPWYRIKEDPVNDDNPDITDYMGHGELRAAYKWNRNVFTFMSRNNIESNFSKGAIEFSWSFPLGDYPFLKGYVQYFSGYGESLIDYNHNVNRIGFGIALTDLL